MKIVNKEGGILFFLALFGISIFFILIFFSPTQVSAPKSNALSTINHQSSTEPLPQPVPEPKTTLVFTGDIMLARSVEQAIKTNGANYPFTQLSEELFKDAHAVIGNFEGTVREEEHIEGTNVMAFDTLPAYIPALKDIGFTHLSLANNHADDFGQTTTDKTRNTLQENNLVPFGDPFASENFTVEIPGEIPVTLIGFHAFGEDPEGMIDAIISAKAKEQFVIIYPHWGNEYEHTPSSAQKNAATLWVDAGADLIIGAHPHVVQSEEIMDTTPVIYSLGNFLFDQDFSVATTIGAAVRVTITKEEITTDFFPISIKNRQMFIDETKNEELTSWLNIGGLSQSINHQL